MPRLPRSPCTLHTPPVLHGEPSPTPEDLRDLQSAHARCMAALTCPCGATRAPTHPGCAVAAGPGRAAAGPRQRLQRRQSGWSLLLGRPRECAALEGRQAAVRAAPARRGRAPWPRRAPRPAELRTRPPCASRLQRAFRASGVPRSSPEVSSPPGTQAAQRREGAVPLRGRQDHQPCLSAALSSSP